MVQSNKILAALEQYRLLSTPIKLSWKKYWVSLEDTLSSDLFFKLSLDEQQQNINRFKESCITLCPNIKSREGKKTTIWDVINIIKDLKNQNIQKTNRQVLYSSHNGIRPIGQNAWNLWNGFQAIDLDIKNAELAVELKKIIFEKLCVFNWFIGVVLSSSGKGLHVYTKIAIPQKNNENPEAQKILYTANFRHKYSYVYLAVISGIRKLKFTKDDVLKWMDLAMFKPQQGVFIGYDSDPYISSHYFEDFIYVGYENSAIDWLTYPDLVEIFKRWEWFSNETTIETTPEISISYVGDIKNIKNKRHYKHKDRWRLANTLVKLYGLSDGYKCLRAICSKDTGDHELYSICRTAATHSKPIDSWAINLLNKNHGFAIKANIDNIDNVENHKETSSELLFSAMHELNNPLIIRESTNKVYKFNLNSNQYLSDIKKDILNNLGKISLLEAGPGLGKTEFIKELVSKDKKRILFIMPFTSTIKAKTESNTDDWEYAYGNKQVNLNTSKNGLCITIDKFSKLNIMDIAISNFKYIVIDESHLLFQSEYRPIMSRVIDMIAHLEIPIILMSGTPSGELTFFPDSIHIQVYKEDLRKKVFKVYIADTIGDLLGWLGKHMADDIASGKKVFFPTNRGTQYFNQIVASVNWFLETEHSRFEGEEVKAAYYKKSNIGEDFMDSINFKKTVGEIELLGSSQYMSVGVDILDKYNFSIYICDGGFDTFMPQEILQFANRLRSHDLYINFFTARENSSGVSRQIHKYRELNWQLNDDEIKDIHSILKICNNSIHRNPIEYKYNPIVLSILSANPFIEYNSDKNEYILDETHYKTVQWERKYRDYVQQLPVIMKGMEAYGFEIFSQDLGKIDIDNQILAKEIRKSNFETQQIHEKFISEILSNLNSNSFFLYKDIARGKYEIRKGKTWKVEIEKHQITCTNVEALLKTLPFINSFSKFWNCDTIRRAFEMCKLNNNNGYNWAALRRLRTLNNIIHYSKLEKIDIPLKDFVNKSYEFADQNNGNTTRKDLTNFISSYIMEFVQKEENNKIKISSSPLTLDFLTRKFEDIFKCIIHISGKKNIQLTRAELPENSQTEEKDDWLSLFLGE